jgi:hypothetical protein
VVVNARGDRLVGVLLVGESTEWEGTAFVKEAHGPRFLSQPTIPQPGGSPVDYDGDPDDAEALADWNLMTGAETAYWPTATALAILTAANVELRESAGPPRGHVAHGVPHLEVLVRSTSRRADVGGAASARNWSHRWEVRGHFKHYGPDTRIFQAAPPEKVIAIPVAARLFAFGALRT